MISPLTDAILEGNHQKAEALIKEGKANVNDDLVTVSGIRGTRPYDLMKGLIIRYQAGTHAKSRGMTPLMAASSHGCVENVKFLLTQGAKDSIDWCSPLTGRKTALHFAAEHGAPEVVELLLKNGASIKARTETGRLPLHTAAAYGHVAAMRILHKADPLACNERDNKAYTPLMVAAHCGVAASVKFLLSETDACTDVRTQEGYSVLILAAEANDLQTMKVLLESCRFLMNPENEFAWGAMRLAIINNNPEIVKILLDHGANKSLLDPNKYDSLKSRASTQTLTLLKDAKKHNKPLLSKMVNEVWTAAQSRPLAKL